MARGTESLEQHSIRHELEMLHTGQGFFCHVLQTEQGLFKELFVNISCPVPSINNVQSLILQGSCTRKVRLQCHHLTPICNFVWKPNDRV